MGERQRVIRRRDREVRRVSSPPRDPWRLPVLERIFEQLRELENAGRPRTLLLKSRARPRELARGLIARDRPFGRRGPGSPTHELAEDTCVPTFWREARKHRESPTPR